MFEPALHSLFFVVRKGDQEEGIWYGFKPGKLEFDHESKLENMEEEWVEFQALFLDVSIFDHTVT